MAGRARVAVWQTHSLYCEDGQITVGPPPSHGVQPLVPCTDGEPPLPGAYASFGLVPKVYSGLDLVTVFHDNAFAALQTLPGFVSGTYPGHVLHHYRLYSSYILKIVGRRPFKMYCLPIKTNLYDSQYDMGVLTADFTRLPKRQRPVLWFAPTVDAPRHSAEVHCAIEVTVRLATDTAAAPTGLWTVDLLLTQPHVPVRVRNTMKASRVIPGVYERPVDPAAPAPQETCAQTLAAENAYVATHGSRGLYGSTDRSPADAYHGRLGACAVALGHNFHFRAPTAVHSVCDLTPCLKPDRYGTVPLLAGPGSRATGLRGGPRY
jgi:hypothetical protein